MNSAANSQQFALEALEARILLSGDTIGLTQGGGGWEGAGGWLPTQAEQLDPVQLESPGGTVAADLTYDPAGQVSSIFDGVAGAEPDADEANGTAAPDPAADSADEAVAEEQAPKAATTAATATSPAAETDLPPTAAAPLAQDVLTSQLTETLRAANAPPASASHSQQSEDVNPEPLLLLAPVAGEQPRFATESNPPGADLFLNTNSTEMLVGIRNLIDGLAQASQSAFPDELVFTQLTLDDTLDFESALLADFYYPLISIDLAGGKHFTADSPGDFILATDAEFSIQVGGDDAIGVLVSAGDTGDNLTLDDLVADFTNALPAGLADNLPVGARTATVGLPDD